MVMTGAHDRSLVALSIVIAIIASYTALSVGGRIRASKGWVRRVWLAAAAAALGGGIWSMHFVAMLAFSMPHMHMTYDLGLTSLSLALAVVFTGAGFALMGWRKGPPLRLVPAGLLMGSGVVAMHYVGMAAMRLPAALSYDRFWFGISVLVAIGAATAAVWLASIPQRVALRLAAATLMGAAIAGMHYAGMRAAVFTVGTTTPFQGVASVDQTYLAIAVAGITIAILLLALGAAGLDRLLLRAARREARISLRLKIADILRGNSTPAALNEVVELMGRHFAVTRAGYGQLDPQEDIFDYDICWTDGTVPPLLGRFPASAFGVKIVAALKAGRTVVVEDLLEAELSNEPLTHETAREVDTRSILVVPFVRDGQLRTIVYLNDRKPRKWRAEDVSFLEELAERTRLVIERDTVEKQLRELNATLEARVEARTAELQEAQKALLQSQKMEAVGQLVSGIAHDFNNLLGAVIGSFELIRRRAHEPDRVETFAQAGLEAASRGSKLTTQLLAFSRSQTIQLRPVLVGEVLGSLKDLLRRTLGPMIELEFQLDAGPVAVLADATQLEMMVLNLAINARDAMPAGGSLKIATSVRTIAGEPELADGPHVEISVTDTGIGMDETVLRRAMEPFFTTKPVGKGTGLGLAQIYGSVRQAGGAVRLESTPGIGTTVRVLLPQTEAAPPTPGAVEGQSSATLERAVHVLVVDDDHDHRSVLVSCLESLGHKVEQAVDGGSALAMLEMRQPEVMLLDFAMPGMNGAAVASEANRRWPRLPIVFTSGLADTAAIEAAVGKSAVILRKPFLMNELLEALGEALAVRCEDANASLATEPSS